MVPHLVELDHGGSTLGLRLLSVDLGEPLDPGLHRGRRHPNSFAVRLIDRPLTWSGMASTFTRSGIPRGGVSVKFRPQALQR